jgi:HK97 family phage prohead protease
MALMPSTKPKIDGREIRALTTPLELRAAAEGQTRTAAGYAALFNVETDIGGYWTETVAPGAFAKSLKERDCLAVHSHDIGRVIGRMKAGTLFLREDEKGLAFECQLPDTSDGRDLAVQIERGDIAGMSFGFRSVRSEWDETVEPPKRTIIEAELYEITFTPMPAYPETEVGLRSLEGARQERRERNKSAAGNRIARRMRLKQSERKF